MTEPAKPFAPRELRAIAERATSLARGADDPSIRIALSLFAESAMNLAAKLPRSDERALDG